jgi:hypothetical protein
MDDAFQCYTLEPTSHRQDGECLAIPSGTYEVVMYDSPHFGFKVPLYVNVPGHTFVEMHPGNCSRDTHDCTCVGDKKDKDFIEDSDVTFKEVVSKIQEKINAGHFYATFLGGPDRGQIA